MLAQARCSIPVENDAILLPPDVRVQATIDIVRRGERRSPNFFLTRDLARELALTSDAKQWVWRAVPHTVEGPIALDAMHAESAGAPRPWEVQQPIVRGDPEIISALRKLVSKPLPKERARGRGRGRGRGQKPNTVSEDKAEDDEAEAAPLDITQELIKLRKTRSEIILNAHGKHCGFLNTLFGQHGVSVVITCKCIGKDGQAHACKRIVRSESIPCMNAVRTWVRMGAGIGEDDHKQQFFKATGIVPVSQQRGRK